MTAMVPLLQTFADQLPGPDLSIDFSRGDWWLVLLAWFLNQWLAGRRSSR